MENTICIIASNDLDSTVVWEIAENIFNTKKKKSVKGGAYILPFDTITEAINKRGKDKIRAFVISSQNINLIAELNVIKQEWLNIITDNYNCLLKQKDVYFVIDVIPCSIDDLEHCHLKDCINIYSIGINSNDIVKNVKK